MLAVVERTDHHRCTKHWAVRSQQKPASGRTSSHSSVRSLGARLRSTLRLVALVALPLQVCAQHVKRPVPLAIPDGEVLRCIRPESAQLLTQVREFRVGPPEMDRTPEGLERGRKITIAADTLGRPLLLVEETSLGWLGGVIITRVMSADSAGSKRVDITIDSISMARAIAAVDIEGVNSAMRILPHRMLNATERVRADSLATWLWARRCGRAD